MTDKPKIEVGQRWVTREGRTVRVLATNALGNDPVICQIEDSEDIERWKADGRMFENCPDGLDLISLAPQTAHREVALYRDDAYICVMDAMQDTGGMHRISHTVLVEFTILPGESA